MRAAIYTRVSTDDQAREGFSLDEQEHRGLQLIAREDGWQHVGTYSDPGRSGADRDRPDLRRLLADVAAGGVDVVIVAALDRLSRDAGHLRELLLLFDAAGVRVIASGQALDRDTPEGILQTGILAEFAEFERRKIKARTKAGIASRARTSGKPWGKCAFGLRRDADGNTEWDPVERPVLERIYAMRASGATKNGIARQLTRDGVPTRTGARWSAMVVSRILRGREPLGEFHHGGEWLRGGHEAVMSDEAWLAVQALDEQSRKYAPGGRSGRMSERHLFQRGALRCACGAAMLPRSARDQADNYVCRTHKFDAGLCPMPPVRRDVIDSAALTMFEEVALDVEATRAHLVGQLDARAGEVNALLARAEREAAATVERLTRVQRAFQDGVIEAADWAEQRPGLIGERDAAGAELDRLATQADALAAEQANVDAESETLRRLAELRAAIAGRLNGSGDLPALRAALAAVCGEVTLRAVEDGAVVLDYRPSGEDWERVGLGLDVAADNRSGSGVPL
jgi:site-specific DNA recombinase